jgi:hypothetical protein
MKQSLKINFIRNVTICCDMYRLYCLYCVKRGQPTKYKFYKRSKKVAPFYTIKVL